MTTRAWILLAGLLTSAVHADHVQLTGGGRLTGSLTGYANAAFQLALTNGAVTNLAASTVRDIDFEHGQVAGTLTMTGGTTLTGTVWLVSKQFVHLTESTNAMRKVPVSQLTGAQFQYVPSPAKPRPAPVAKPTPLPAPVRRRTDNPDNSEITRGDRVDILRHLVDGKATVVAFCAQWAEDCRSVTQFLDHLAREDADVAVRRVDILRWKSPVADQYDITRIPQFKVYNRQGRLAGTMAGAGSVEELVSLVDAAKTNAVAR